MCASKLRPYKALTPPVLLLHEFPTSVEFNPGITHENTILLGTFKHCQCLHPTVRDSDSDSTGERPAKGCFFFLTSQVM